MTKRRFFDFLDQKEKNFSLILFRVQNFIIFLCPFRKSKTIVTNFFHFIT